MQPSKNPPNLNHASKHRQPDSTSSTPSIPPPLDVNTSNPTSPLLPSPLKMTNVMPNSPPPHSHSHSHSPSSTLSSNLEKLRPKVKRKSPLNPFSNPLTQTRPHEHSAMPSTDGTEHPSSSPSPFVDPTIDGYAPSTPAMLLSQQGSEHDPSSLKLSALPSEPFAPVSQGPTAHGHPSRSPSHMAPPSLQTSGAVQEHARTADFHAASPGVRPARIPASDSCPALLPSPSLVVLTDDPPTLNTPDAHRNTLDLTHQGSPPATLQHANTYPFRPPPSAAAALPAQNVVTGFVPAPSPPNSSYSEEDARDGLTPLHDSLRMEMLRCASLPGSSAASPTTPSPVSATRTPFRSRHLSLIQTFTASYTPITSAAPIPTPTALHPRALADERPGHVDTSTQVAATATTRTRRITSPYTPSVSPTSPGPPPPPQYAHLLPWTASATLLSAYPHSPHASSLSLQSASPSASSSPLHSPSTPTGAAAAALGTPPKPACKLFVKARRNSVAAFAALSSSTLVPPSPSPTVASLPASILSASLAHPPNSSGGGSPESPTSPATPVYPATTTPTPTGTLPAPPSPSVHPPSSWTPSLADLMHPVLSPASKRNSLTSQSFSSLSSVCDPPPSPSLSPCLSLRSSPVPLPFRRTRLNSYDASKPANYLLLGRSPGLLPSPFSQPPSPSITMFQDSEDPEEWPFLTNIQESFLSTPSLFPTTHRPTRLSRSFTPPPTHSYRTHASHCDPHDPAASARPRFPFSTSVPDLPLLQSLSQHEMPTPHSPKHSPPPERTAPAALDPASATTPTPQHDREGAPPEDVFRVDPHTLFLMHARQTKVKKYRVKPPDVWVDWIDEYRVAHSEPPTEAAPPRHAASAAPPRRRRSKRIAWTPLGFLSQLGLTARLGQLHREAHQSLQHYLNELSALVEHAMDESPGVEVAPTPLLQILLSVATLAQTLLDASVDDMLKHPQLVFYHVEQLQQCFVAGQFCVSTPLGRCVYGILMVAAALARHMEIYTTGTRRTLPNDAAGTGLVSEGTPASSRKNSTAGASEIEGEFDVDVEFEDGDEEEEKEDEECDDDDEETEEEVEGRESVMEEEETLLLNAVFELNLNGTFRYVSPELCLLVGWEEQDEATGWDVSKKPLSAVFDQPELLLQALHSFTLEKALQDPLFSLTVPCGVKGTLLHAKGMLVKNEANVPSHVVFLCSGFIHTVFCHICERKVATLLFEAHNHICMQAHKAEMDMRLALDQLHEYKPMLMETHWRPDEFEVVLLLRHWIHSAQNVQFHVDAFNFSLPIQICPDHLPVSTECCPILVPKCLVGHPAELCEWATANTTERVQWLVQEIAGHLNVYLDTIFRLVQIKQSYLELFQKEQSIDLKSQTVLHKPLPPTPILATSAVAPMSSAPSIRDYTMVKPISKGAFGSVYLAKKKTTGKYFAIKILKKADMIAKNQVTNVKAERMILMSQLENPFVVQLYCSFQSKDALYLVMEYLNGGDCASLLKAMGCLPEAWAKKYIAEMVLCLEYLHAKGIVHRDLKPDNFLIHSSGHLRLTDFGLSKLGFWGRQSTQMYSVTTSTLLHRNNSTKLATEAGGLSASPSDRPTSPETKPSVPHLPPKRFVGTPDYLAPEAILGTSVGTEETAVDWWAIGVILYEFLYGIPPFHAESVEGVFENILRGKVVFPDDIETDIEEDMVVSPAAKDLILKLLCSDPTQRLGSAANVKQHAFFEDVCFEVLLSDPPAFLPEPSHSEDTEYFDPRGCDMQVWDRGLDVAEGVAEFGSFTYRNLPLLEKANRLSLVQRRHRASRPQTLRETSLSPSRSSPVPPPAPGPRQAPATHALICDDNPVSCKCLQMMVLRLGVNAVLAQNGAEAVKLALGLITFHFIFMDSKMPVMDGEQAAKLIRCADHANRQSVIIGMENEEHEIQARTYFTSIMKKPLFSHQIASILKFYSPSTPLADEKPTVITK